MTNEKFTADEALEYVEKQVKPFLEGMGASHNELRLIALADEVVRLRRELKNKKARS